MVRRLPFSRAAKTSTSPPSCGRLLTCTSIDASALKRAKQRVPTSNVGSFVVAVVVTDSCSASGSTHTCSSAVWIGWATSSDGIRSGTFFGRGMVCYFDCKGKQKSPRLASKAFISQSNFLSDIITHHYEKSCAPAKKNPERHSCARDKTSFEVFFLYPWRNKNSVVGLRLSTDHAKVSHLTLPFKGNRKKKQRPAAKCTAAILLAQNTRVFGLVLPPKSHTSFHRQAANDLFPHSH